MHQRWLIRSTGLILLTAWLVALGAGNSAVLTWTAPTAYTDGSALPPSDLGTYTITWVAGTGGGPAGSISVAAPALTATVPVACGSVAFRITVTTSASARYPNETSVPTGPVPYVTGISCLPNPPGALSAK